MALKFPLLDTGFKVDWYRCPIDRSVLRSLTARSDLKGLFQAGGHLILLALTGAGAYLAYSNQLWVVFALSLFAHGTVFSFVPGYACHELAHGTVFKTKWLNRAFLWVYGVLGWFNFNTYRESHTYHHRNTLHRGADGEVQLPNIPTLKPHYLLQLFTVNLLGGLESVGLIPTLYGTFRLALTGRAGWDRTFDKNWINELFDRAKPSVRRRAVTFSWVTILFHTAVIVASVASGQWLIAVLVSGGAFIANWWKYFVGTPMHTGLRDNVNDFRLCCRSITLDPLSTFLFWRMNWHTEHHMFAAVPCYNLKKLAVTIAHDMPKPRSLVGAWREMRDTLRRQHDDPTYQFNTPLPDDGSEAGLDRGFDDEASLGDLATE